MNEVKAKGAMVVWDHYEEICLDAYRMDSGYALSLKENYLGLIIPDGFKDAGPYTRVIDVDSYMDPALVYVVECEDGTAHVEPFWARPYERKLPDGYEWADGGALLNMGAREPNGSTCGRYSNEEVLLPIYDHVVKSGTGESADDIGFQNEKAWKAYLDFGFGASGMDDEELPF